jgi:hypothetical protein
MNEPLDEARIALRCDNPLIRLQAAANGIGIVGDQCRRENGRSANGPQPPTSTCPSGVLTTVDEVIE